MDRYGIPGHEGFPGSIALGPLRPARRSRWRSSDTDGRFGGCATSDRTGGDSLVTGGSANGIWSFVIQKKYITIYHKYITAVAGDILFILLHIFIKQSGESLGLNKPNQVMEICICIYLDSSRYNVSPRFSEPQYINRGKGINFNSNLETCLRVTPQLIVRVS